MDIRFQICLQITIFIEVINHNLSLHIATEIISPLVREYILDDLNTSPFTIIVDGYF